MLNVNDDKYQEKEVKAVFNDGNAGVARNCTCRIQKRTADDKEGSPKYKLFFTDANGAEINRAYFEVKDSTSDASKTFLIKDLKHILSQCGLTIEKDAKFKDENDFMDYVMVKSKDIIKTHRFGVAVCYGSIKKPSQYLEVDGYWGYRNEENIDDKNKLQLSSNALLKKIEPKNPGVDMTGTEKGGWSGGTNDLPF